MQATFAVLANIESGFRDRCGRLARQRLGGAFSNEGEHHGVGIDLEVRLFAERKALYLVASRTQQPRVVMKVEVTAIDSLGCGLRL